MSFFLQMIGTKKKKIGEQKNKRKEKEKARKSTTHLRRDRQQDQSTPASTARSIDASIHRCIITRQVGFSSLLPFSTSSIFSFFSFLISSLSRLVGDELKINIEKIGDTAIATPPPVYPHTPLLPSHPCCTMYAVRWLSTASLLFS